MGLLAPNYSFFKTYLKLLCLQETIKQTRRFKLCEAIELNPKRGCLEIREDELAAGSSKFYVIL